VQRKLQNYHARGGGGELKLRLAPKSGFFLYHNNVRDSMVWQEQMQYLFHMSNWTLTDTECVDMYEKELQWLCLFPQNLYKFIRPPIFVLNSALDSFQVSNFLASEQIEGFPSMGNPIVSSWSNFNASAAPGWANCSGVDGRLDKCGPTQIDHMNAYMDSFVARIKNDRAFKRRGNGAFVYGCFDHNAEIRDVPHKMYTVGGLAMRDALSAWWCSDAAPAHSFTHVEGGRYKYPASVTDTSPSCMFL